MRSRPGRDYYAALGVAVTATEEEIKRAYRRLALQYHPDRNPGDRQAEERFKQLAEAYAVLMDSTRRRDYDEQRRARGGGGSRPPRWREEDVFRDLFRDRRSASVFDDLGPEWARQGLRFDEAFLRQVFFSGRGTLVIGPFGVRWVGRFGRRAAAEGVTDPARGSGGAVPVPSLSGFFGWAWARVKETLAAPLRLLGGHRASRPSPRGDLQYEVALPAEDLSRGGRYRLTIERAGGAEELVVTVPSGMRPGTRLRLRGKGEAGKDGTPGDLYLHVRAQG
jgi:curved DNA-binding protein CbpA